MIQAALSRLYRDDPLGYTRDVLGITLTPPQVRVVERMLSERRVLVSSGHSVGKSLLAACLVCWFFDTRSIGIVLTTAPTKRQVETILWKEVRTLRRRAGLPDQFAGPRAPHLFAAPDHYAMGFTARDANRFQGHHSPGGLLVIFDEAEGLDDAEFYRALKTMLDRDSYFLAIYNPTGGSGTPTHLAEQQADEQGLYARDCLSCLEHPNVISQEAGGDVLIPGAIDREQLLAMLLEDSVVLGETDPEAPGDVRLAGRRFRAGPIAGARCLGRRADVAVATVWWEELWRLTLANRTPINPLWPVVVGCDVARFGDDQTAIVVRKGVCAMHAETHAKLTSTAVAMRCKEICHRFKDDHNPERRIPVLVDDTGGFGGGVVDQAGDYHFVGINASRKPMNPARYVNTRAELWFMLREAAMQRDRLTALIDLSRLDVAIQKRLKMELIATRYKVNRKNQYEVLSKEDTKQLLGRSPDLADAMNLAFYPIPKIQVT